MGRPVPPGILLAVEKQRARQIFDQIVDATVPRDPALLEWERGNVFKMRIFPIPAHGDRRVRLSYSQVLPVVGDRLRYRFPMGGTGASGTSIDRSGMRASHERTDPETMIPAIRGPMM